MKKNKNFIFVILAAVLTLILIFISCATGAAPVATDTADQTASLDSLLRVVPFQIERWDDRDVIVYNFNTEIKDDLFQALKDAGFHQTGSGEWNRGLDWQSAFLRWCVFPDNNGELQFSAAGDTTVYTYHFKYGIPQIISVTGIPQGSTEARIMLIGIDSEFWIPGYGTEINGQTATLISPWSGNGNINIELWVSPSPRDPSRNSAKYVYSANGVNQTPFDIKDEVTTLEWSKFIWIEDWDYIPG